MFDTEESQPFLYVV